MQRHARSLFLAAILLPTLAACGARDQDQTPAGAGAVDRIIAKETRASRNPDERRGVEIRRAGFEKVFAGTALQYSATFSEENRIDLGLIGHRLAGQQMLASGATLQNLPMTSGAVSVAPDQGDAAPGVTLTGVPGYEDVSMRMHEGTVTIVSLDHEKDAFAGLPVVTGFEVNFDGRFLAFSDDASRIVENPAGNRGVSISGAIRWHKE